MKVEAVVLSNNSRDYISGCLESLSKLVLGDTKVEIVVVDNASTDDSAGFIKTRFPDVTVLANSQNLGYAEGNNIGIRYSLAQNCDFLWLVGPDVTVDKNCLSELMFAATRYPGSGIFCPKIFKTGGNTIWYAGGQMDWDKIQNVYRGADQPDSGVYSHDVEVDFVPGECMFIRKRIFDTVGLIDPGYFQYYEENDLCQRTMLGGWKLMFVAKGLAWISDARRLALTSNLKDYYQTRNRLLFGLRYGGLLTKINLLKDSAGLYFIGRPWQKRAVTDFYHKNLGAGSFQP